MTAYPRDWAGRLQATPAQVATAERLIAAGLAKPIPPMHYSPKAKVHLQLTHMVSSWRSAGRVYVAKDGKIIGHGQTLAEARRNGWKELTQ